MNMFTKEQALKILSKMGINITQATLLYYRKHEAIKEPLLQLKGIARRSVRYNKENIKEIFIVNCFLHGKGMVVIHDKNGKENIAKAYLPRYELTDIKYIRVEANHFKYKMAEKNITDYDFYFMVDTFKELKEEFLQAFGNDVVSITRQDGTVYQSTRAEIAKYDQKTATYEFLLFSIKSWLLLEDVADYYFERAKTL